MPALVAFFIRQLLIIGVQLGIFSLLERYIVPLLNSAIQKIVVAFGVNETEAHDILANEILEGAEALGLTVALSRARLPLLMAEKLGFTSKGFVKRKLKPATEAKVAKAKLASKGVVATDAAIAQEVAGTVAKSRGFSLDVVSKLATTLVAVLGIPIGAGLLIINTIDFAAWPTSSYQDTFQRFFAFFGIKPDADAKNSKVLSQDQWNKVFNIYQTLGAIGIDDPYKGINLPFTRQNLIDLVDKVAANMIAEKGKATVGWIIGATQGLIVMGSPVTPNKIATAFAGSYTSPGGETTQMTGTQTTKVYTGIISQGVLGAGLVFTPRPDDLIESVAELKAAAANNLAPFLAALPAKVVYEVKVVSYIITKDGFKQTGTTQKVQSGYDALGKPKYKSVTNKFATLVLYVFTDKGTRTKISTIVLGPVDSVKLKVGTNDLRALEMELPKLVTTQDMKEIQTIQTPAAANIKVETPTAPVEKYLTATGNGNPKYRYYKYEINTEWYYEPILWLGNDPFGYVPLSFTDFINGINAAMAANPTRWREFYDGLRRSKPDAFNETTPAVSASSTAGPKAGANATTLFEWYQAKGQQVPSVSERSLIYEGLGLGQRSYYTGTSEQNTKLLTALKAQ